MKQNILKLGFLLLGLFLILVGYLSYLQVVRNPALASNPYNRRVQEMENQTVRGNIYDAKGVVLARTEFDGKQGRRVYPQGDVAAHIIGYVSDRYGRAGLESAYDSYLLGMEGSDSVRNFINRLLGKEQKGGDLTLTIDSSLQELAEQLLGNRRGAVVLVDTRTGALRVVASAPGYDPNRLEEYWPVLVQAADSPLLNRAAQGAYPPGSTFKIITAAGALADKPGLADSTFNCQGYLMVGGYKLTDLAVHGEVDLKKALAVSCNTTFAQLGLGLGTDSFYRTFKAFGLDQDPGPGIAVRPGTLAAPGDMIQTELASSAIGQGEVLVSPLHMALAAAAIANQGVIMHPYLVESVRDSSGAAVQSVTQRQWLTATTPAISGIIKEGMIDAVRGGTATAAAVSGVKVAGKTGSAQNPHGKTHAWFIGFAPAEQPRLAVAVVLENAGSGASVAAPVAGSLLATALAKGY
ncbi:cell division protein FtsI [Pelotomaculum terephthalicicum JT]|uniref:peptidoglycan D,D-transpeptidase FtsI family protein n=1 Tax=Pelotomaculum TaxID=191373 RepID=UPI0009CF2786|nr:MULTISPECIES: penicillin-binding transpeptidase domain-containing protein [Pelotomaculum]MCG9968464.1 cell division protein FtsI [Pelotomaculum terephthalicicum JT]OPX88888.1 MAG: Penicillin-binding protein A [Pelotomaculum sp. PtaB.Bin117]